jgi:hypothetical protein
MDDVLALCMSLMIVVALGPFAILLLALFRLSLDDGWSTKSLNILYPQAVHVFK